MTDSIRIVVAHDHPITRGGIVEMLDASKDLSVVGQGATTTEMISLTRALSPDVLVLNIDGSGPDIENVLTEIAKSRPVTRVVALATNDDPERLAMLLKSGVSAYLLMTGEQKEISATVRRAVRGDDCVLLATSRMTLQKLLFAPRTRSVLSARETQVLGLLGQAQSNRQIARTLIITDGTVKRHLSNIYGKLGAKSRLDAVCKARAAGFL